MASQVTQVLTQYPLPAPQITDSQDVFSQRAFSKAANDVVLVTQINTLVSQMNTVATDVNTNSNTATTKASDAANSATASANSATLAQNWSTKATTEVVTGQGYSAKEWATGAAVESSLRHASGTTTTGSSKDWATKVSATVASGEYSAKEYAQGSTVESAKRHASGTTTTGSAKDWATKDTTEVVTGQGYSAKKYANDASTSATQAASLVEKYLGSASSDPATDKTGGALTAGDWYVNSTSGLIRAYTGSSWVNGISSVAGVTTVNGGSGAITVQPTLISGTNIKTVNGTTLLGPGDIATPTTTVNNTLTSISTTEALSAAQGKVLQDGKQATLVSGTNIKTINGSSVLGGGNLVIEGLTLAQAQATALYF